MKPPRVARGSAPGTPPRRRTATSPPDILGPMVPDVGSSAQDGTSGALPVSVTRQGPVAVISVSGELDLATTPELRRALDDVLGQLPGAVVVDLTELLFIASVGIAALMWAHAQSAANGIRFAVVAAGYTLRPLEVTGVAAQVAVYPTLTDALGAASGA